MKTVRKTVCLVGLWAAAVGLSSQLSAQAPAVRPQAPPGIAKKLPPPPPPEAARVLDLSGSIPIIIDEPGYYRLDRNWDLNDQGEFGSFLFIRANSVTLDFRGYRIWVLNEGPAVNISGVNVTLRNGTIIGGDDQGLPLSANGRSLTIENMNVGGLNGSYFGSTTSSGLVIRDSSFGGVGGVPPGSTIERSGFGCGFANGVTISDDTRVIDSVWAECGDRSGLFIEGSGNLVERNVFGPSRFPSILVNGRGNLLRDNTIQVDGLAGPAIQVNNGANVLEANVVLPIPGGDRATVGIQFTADGNRFGNNRLGALVPFDVGSTTQTDWGGNVGF